MLAAQERAGKTWAALDLAVSVATGRPWLDHFACPNPGPVLMFLGEGGERVTVRRIEAIATAKGVDPDQLADRLRLCFRVPRLAAPDAGGELAAIEAELAGHPAALVVLDPLHLAAAGASGSNLYDMGAVLQAIQGVCQQAGSALLVVTHWNKTGDGRGADRISGAGPAAWARVICSVSIQHRGSDPDGASTVLLGVELIGVEIADTHFRIRRRVRSEDPADLGSSPGPSRPPLASWKRPGWREGARKAAAGPATGHRPPPIRMPTAPATGKRAMVGERAGHDPPGKVLDRGLAEPAHGTTHGAFCSLLVTDLRTAPRKERPHQRSAAPRAPGGRAGMLDEWSR